MEPEFLKVWSGAESHYCDLIQAVARGEEYQGVSHQPYNRYVPASDTLSMMVHKMLESVDVMLDFCENGSMVLGRLDDVQTTGQSPASALCVIGGVKDIEDSEHAILNDICEKLNKTKRSVSLGIRPELTSKCVKAVGEMNRSSKFSKAVSQLVQKGLPPPPPQQKQTPRPHLHFIVVVPATTTLVEFIERPGIPTMLVDAFINSHGVYVDTGTLSSRLIEKQRG